MDGIDALELLMRLAAQETVAAGYCQITPAHLLIALSRLSEVDEAAQMDGATLRSEFEQLGIEPRRFRRRLRALLGDGGAGPPESPIHRSPECKAVFTRAQAMAAQQGARLGPEHLLHATFVCLAGGSGLRAGQGSGAGQTLPLDEIPTEL